MQQLSILGFNIRINLLTDGKNSWKYRKDKVISFIKENDFPMIGFQEVGPGMMKELKSELTNYESYGVGRDHNQEATPIFIKKNEYSVIEHDTLWLSLTPSVESKIKGSNFPRIVTYVIVKTKNNKKIAFFNTHLDYESDEVCLKQAIVLKDIVSKISFDKQVGILIAGDFNQKLSSKTIKYLSSHYESVYNDRNNVGLTFNGFSSDTKGEPIDHIFYSNKLKLASFNIVHNKTQGFFLSDHYPIFARFNF